MNVLVSCLDLLSSMLFSITKLNRNVNLYHTCSFTLPNGCKREGQKDMKVKAEVRWLSSKLRPVFLRKRACSALILQSSTMDSSLNSHHTTGWNCCAPVMQHQSWHLNGTGQKYIKHPSVCLSEMQFCWLLLSSVKTTKQNDVKQIIWTWFY